MKEDYEAVITRALYGHQMVAKDVIKALGQNGFTIEYRPESDTTLDSAQDDGRADA